jgi:putative transcriptional regulator
MVEGLHALCDAVEAGVPLEKAVTVRTSTTNARPPVLSPSQIRAIRSSLNLSETLFATFLGVRIATLRSWEQGRSAPSSVARRFLVVIRDDPGYWKAKFAEAAPRHGNGLQDR